MARQMAGILVVLVLALAACGDDGGTGGCDVGATQACATTCGSSGQQVCGADGVFGQCTPPAQETCGDNVDNNCNGVVDDGCTTGGACTTIGSQQPCKTTCSTDGTQVCGANGQWGSCVAVEVCNSKDDNCDGQVDNGISCGGTCTPGAAPQPCVFVGPNNCQAISSQKCDNTGHWETCPAPQETCNKLDDNCNGQTDEGLTCTTNCQSGSKQFCKTACGTDGTQECVNQTWAACVAVELCNGKDEDCDGNVDNGLQQDCQTACGTGKETCANGTWGTCSAPIPEGELCDGKDNDCDGKADEDNLGQPLTDKCENCGTGYKTCANGAWGPCSAQPQPEICDKIDNDCNGKVDDAPNGCTCTVGQTQACGTDKGECNPGTQSCQNGVWSECGGDNYKGSTPEKCDGLDNDCNGIVDEGNPEGGQACGTANKSQGGTASAPCQLGQMKCEGGQLKCVGGVDPTPEICDGIDNDCNGSKDDNVTGDQWEKNNSCSAGADIGWVMENQGAISFQGTLFPDGDADWYTFIGGELSNFCWPGDPEGPYTVTVTLKGIPTKCGTKDCDYDLCVWSEDDGDCSDWPATGPCEDLNIWKEGNTPETYTYTWDGSCSGNDDKVFYVKVVNYNDTAKFNCEPYTVQVEMTSK